MIHAAISGERPETQVGWRTLPGPSHAAVLQTHPRAARLGAAIAAVICVFIAWVGWLIAPPTGWIVGAIGFPGAAVLAWKMAPRVIAASRFGAAAEAFVLAIGSIAVADVLVSAFFAAGFIANGIGAATVDGASFPLLEVVTMILQAAYLAAMVFLLGAIIVGIPVALVVVPAALIWAAFVRLLAGRGWAR
jgi:hypothetical protein